MRLRNSISGERGIMALALIVGGKRCGLPKKGMASGNGRTQSGDSRASKNLPLPPSQPKRPNKLLDLLMKKRGGPHSRPASLSPRCASLAPRIDQPLTNDIRRGHNSHRQGDLYRARSRRHRPVTPVTFICPRLWFLPYIDRDMNPYTRSHPIHLEEAK